MTELRDSKTALPTASAGAGDTADPLHNLYRMSRTAGLGSGDYVAINNTAIVALVLGFLSVFSLLYPIMLVAAAAAVVCGIIAFVQVHSSNGTQSGRMLALGAILLGLALGGVSLGKVVIADWQHRQDEQAIDAMIKQLNEKIVAKDYAAAYDAMFTDDFKANFTKQGFAERWQSFGPTYGNVLSIDWGHRADVESVPGTHEKRGVATSFVHFDKFSDPARQPMMFVERDGQWKIDGIGQLFEVQKQAKNQPAMPDPRAPLGPELQLPGVPAAPQPPGPKQ